MNIRSAVAVPGLCSLLAIVLGTGCSAPADDGEDGSAALSGDISKITVTCKDGSTEDATQAQVASGDVCAQDKETDDLFDANSCLGTALDQKALVALMQRLGGTGKSDVKLADDELHFRTRQCNGATGCAEWKELTASDDLLIGSATGLTLKVAYKGSVHLVADSKGAVSIQWNTNGKANPANPGVAVKDAAMFDCQAKDSSCEIVDPLFMYVAGLPNGQSSVQIDTAASVITDHCARIVTTGKGATPLAQIVTLVKFSKK